MAVPAEDDHGLRDARPGFDIARKLLSLLVCSALVPAFLVGLVSYITARQILIEKIHHQLDARLAASKEHLELSLARRVEDAEVFANAFIVGRTLNSTRQAELGGRPETADSIREQLRSYLEEVAGRYLMYRELTVLDRAGEPIAHTQATGTTAWYKRMAADMASKSGIALETDGAEPVVVVWQAVSTQDGERLGTLIAVGGLDQIWRRLLAEVQPEGGRFLVVDETGVPLLDSARPGGDRPRPIDSEGVRRALTGERGVAEYLDESGLAVVGSFRYSTRHRLGLVIELPAEEAFAAVTRMRNVVLLISLLATLFVAGIGSLLALNLTRPIRALSEGAQLVARGDLSAEVPVTSRDQIGDLTRTFNRMVRTLRESREKLENLSMTDELTGLYNRRYLGRILDKELSRARRSGQPLSLLMLDLDHFKAFNDLLGHLEGDALLRQAAQLLTDRFRATDVVSRYGGEEFVAILPATAKVEAAEIAERVRAEFEAHPPFTKLAPRVTLSAGLATYPEDGETQEELLLNADVALYRAKDLGRNRVEMSSLPLKPEDCI